MTIDEVQALEMKNKIFENMKADVDLAEVKKTRIFVYVYVCMYVYIYIYIYIYIYYDH